LQSYAAILFFKKLIFKLQVWCRELACVILENFVAIGQTAAQIRQLFDLSKWRPSARLHFRNSKFYRLTRLKGSQCVIVPNFMAICQTVA